VSDVCVITCRRPPVFTSKKNTRSSFCARFSVSTASVSGRLVQ